MKAALIDTNILSLFFRGHAQVMSRFEAYLGDHETIYFSIITYYEIISGLKHRDAKKKLDIFLDFTTHNTILPLTQDCVNFMQ